MKRIPSESSQGSSSYSGTGASILESRRGKLIVSLLLTLLSAAPRFYNLGHLSLYGDEPYTALAAESVLDTGHSVLPSGMPYSRALAFTWASAGVAGVLGPDRESSYRMASAVTGTLTPPALFLTGGTFVSPPAALVAAAMLGLSEWHIAYSRMGRMYAPFLFFFLLTAFYFWRWGRSGARGALLLGIGLFAVTVSLHVLGLFAAIFAMLPVLFPSRYWRF